MKDTIHVEEGTKQINNVRLYYKVMGKGKTIVILHGGPGMNHTYFLPHMGWLAHYYELIFYDQRACGRSSGVIDSESLTLDNYVEDLEGIRKAFNLDKMNVMGHSFGGLLAMYYGIMYPENLGSLILVDSAPASSKLNVKYMKSKEICMTDGDRITVEKIIQSEGFADRKSLLIEELFRISEKVNFYDQSLIDSFFLKFNEKAAKNVFFINVLMRRDIVNYDIHESLSKIECPTLIIHGDHDTVPLEAAQKIHQHIKNSHYVIFKNCGHYPFIESPAEFFRTVKDFLDNL